MRGDFEALGLLGKHEAEYRYFDILGLHDEWLSFEGPLPDELLNDKPFQSPCIWWDRHTLLAPETPWKSWGRRVQCLSLSGLMVALHASHYLPDVYALWQQGEVVVTPYLSLQALRAVLVCVSPQWAESICRLCAHKRSPVCTQEIFCVRTRDLLCAYLNPGRRI